MPMLIFSLPPVLRCRLNFCDPISFMERYLVVLCRVIAEERRKKIHENGKGEGRTDSYNAIAVMPSSTTGGGVGARGAAGAGGAAGYNQSNKL
jgi:hypothetical protein